MTSTIYAMATPPGRAAVAMMRISGPQTAFLLTSLAGALPPPRVATLRRLRDPHTRTLIDHALVLWFPGPHSYTGEDFGELHLHGGEAVVAAALDAVAALGAAPAEPGAFTRRAFNHGKMDLVQAEAIADLVDAETQAQRLQAVNLLGSGARPYERWCESLLDTAALLEATIDFPDEGLPETLVQPAHAQLRCLHRELKDALQDDRGRKVREGYRIAIIGPPNAGKSSLFNRLVERDASIVTDVAGTTRDIVESSLTIAGYRVILADTAGLRSPQDKIEAEGIRRAREWAGRADLRLIVVDLNTPETLELELGRDGDIIVFNKADVSSSRFLCDKTGHSAEKFIWVQTSALNNDISKLDEALTAAVIQACQAHELSALTRERHRRLVQDGLVYIEGGLQTIAPELVAEHVRLAACALQSIAGRMETEQVLDRVFSAFCIGK